MRPDIKRWGQDPLKAARAAFEKRDAKLVVYGLVHDPLRYDPSGLEMSYQGCEVTKDVSLEWVDLYNKELERLALLLKPAWLPGLEWQDADRLFAFALEHAEAVSKQLRKALIDRGVRDPWLAAEVTEPGAALLVIDMHEFVIFEGSDHGIGMRLARHESSRGKLAAAWLKLGPDGQRRIGACHREEEAEARAAEAGRRERQARTRQRAEEVLAAAASAKNALERAALWCPKCGVPSNDFRATKDGYFVCPRCGRSSPSTDFRF